MWKAINVGMGYRQLSLGELIQPGDEYLSTLGNPKKEWSVVLQNSFLVGRKLKDTHTTFRQKNSHPADLF